RRVGDVPDPHRGPASVLLDGLQRVRAQLAGVSVVVGDHAAEVRPGLDAVRVAARAHRPALHRGTGLGDPAGVAPEDGADLAGGGLRLLDHALRRIRLEDHDRPGRAAVVGLTGRHVRAEGLVAGEVVGVGEGPDGVLLAADDVLQRDVGDLADVPD